jgi:serine/threonine-protein kinase
MASVWSATNIFTEREFAIKFMLPVVARSPEAARRFLLEAKISARINHPNIIEVIDVGQAEDGSLFLVMELLTGQSLETAVRRQVPPMPVKDFVRFMIDVAKALSAAHKSGVIHRDLKPTNIFLHKDRDGVVVPKILDFGVSKILEEETNHALTMAGTVLGSPLYMSPEQAMGAPNLDGRTDIFAFGSIMFEALAGTRAYEAANFNALIVTIATQQPKRIDDHAPHVPEAIRSIVRDCMVTDRNRRIPSFDVVADRLAQALTDPESLKIRLPSPYAAVPPSDPDATNALPVLQNTPAPRSGNSPPGAFSTPWATPPSSRGNIPLALPPWARAIPKWALALGGSGALLMLVAFFVVVATLIGSSGKHAVASAGAASAVLSSSMGRLSITATPGFCAVTVDGASRGSTPVDNLPLGPGAHQIECAPPGGKVRVATVTMSAGEPEKYKFVLDDSGH